MRSLMMAAACGVLALAGSAQAQEAPKASIVVVGVGRVDAAPDTFSMTAEIEGRGSDQAEAVRQMVLVQTTVTDDISRLQGVTAAKVTTGLPAVTPVYPSSCSSQNRTASCVPTGYVASLPITMEGMPAERGGDAVSLAAERGARNARLNGLSMSNVEDIRRHATREAFVDARRQAEDIAEASGQTIRRVLLVEEPNARSDPFYGAGVDIDANSGFVRGLYSYAEAETPITLTPGPVTVRASLTVTFEIE